MWLFRKHSWRVSDLGSIWLGRAWRCVGCCCNVWLMFSCMSYTNFGSTSNKGGGTCVCPHLFVCLSVSKITQKRMHGFGWNVACRQIEPDPDYSVAAGTRLLFPISYVLQCGILLRRENPTYRYWAPVTAATHGFIMVLFTVSCRNNFVGGTCAPLSAPIVNV